MLRTLHLGLAVVLITIGLSSCSRSGGGRTQSASTNITLSPDNSATAWPQWGGPRRDFTASGNALADAWPEAGPRQLWTRTLGGGDSTIVSDGIHLYTMFRDDQGHEAVISLDPKSGETVWKHSYDVTIVEEGPDDVRHVVQFGKGPHATPALKDGYLYTFGFTGILKCIDSSTGKAQWSQDLNALGGSFMRFGCSSSPLIHEDKVIVQIGGKGNGLVAFDRRSGKVRWRATDLDATHSSPIVIDVDGAPLLLSAMSTDVIAVDPSDGQVRWRLAPEGEFQASITTPIWCPNDILFLNLSGDEEGGCALKFSSRGSDIHAERLWFSRKARGSLSNPVRIGNVLYGTAGGRSSIFQAIDVETGKILWRKRGFERCSVVASADGKLVILEEKGKLSIATPTTEGLDVHATVELLTEPAWSAPTLIDDILFVRDSKTIVAVDLGA